MEKHEKHSCCQGKSNSYGAYMIGAVIAVVIILAIANSVFGANYASYNSAENDVSDMMMNCNKMMNGDMMKHMQQMNGGMMSGMSLEEHESHHS